MPLIPSSVIRMLELLRTGSADTNFVEGMGPKGPLEPTRRPRPRKSGRAATLVVVAAAPRLCGEIAITAEIASGQFTEAHIKLARNK